MKVLNYTYKKISYTVTWCLVMGVRFVMIINNKNEHLIHLIFENLSKVIELEIYCSTSLIRVFFSKNNTLL